MNKIGLGILFFNELENAKKILEEIESNEFEEIDFYFLDNGSTQVEFVEWLKSLNSQKVTLFRVDQNLGFGGGAKYLLRTIPNQIVGYMPGNYKIKPSSLTNLYSELPNINELEFYKAKRTGRTFSDRIKTFLLGLFTTLVFNAKMFDSGGTPTLISAKYSKDFQRGPDDFSFEAFSLFIARKRKLLIYRTSVPYGNRIFGNSHWQSGINAELKLLNKIIRSRKSWEMTL